ncbi:MAG: DUF1893 domain-containing protein [Dehalococcoidia bacterium]|nr:MAG: DUF1893 domain-containing protein [Dehalococcoidia bacterium]
MYPRLFYDFLTSNDSLWVYREKELIFSSTEDRLVPLMTYLDRFDNEANPVVFDKIVGNAAALLAVKAGCRELFSPFGSQHAVATLEKYGIRHHLGEVVPAIMQPGGKEMCPMEKLSLGKEPEAFYLLMKERLSANRRRLK